VEQRNDGCRSRRLFGAAPCRLPPTLRQRRRRHGRVARDHRHSLQRRIHFATYVIWGQFAAVENEILKESGALKDLILFSKGRKEATRDPIVRSLRAYARAVTESEWGILSRGEDSERTDKLFSGIISSVTDATATDESERRAHDRLLEIANRASGHRDERLALSVKAHPAHTSSVRDLDRMHDSVSALFYPFHKLALLGFAHFVLTDLDNPFAGTWNVDAKPFDDLATKYR
jgi:hypothetical protein